MAAAIVQGIPPGPASAPPVSGLVDLGTAQFEGVILCQTGITLRTGASIDGRLLAQTAVSIDGSTVVAPAQ